MKLIDFDSIDILEFGNNIEIQGMIIGNGEKVIMIPFYENVDNTTFETEKNWIYDMTKEKWDKLLFQLDNLEAIAQFKDENGKLQKIILRKSQRQIDTNISWNVFRRDNYTCQYCGKNNVPLTVDHIIRWENLGQSVEDNLISACKKCNKTRGNMEFEDWLESSYYKNNIAKIEFDGTKTGNFYTIKNKEMFEKAKKLPLRKFQRSR